MDIVAEREQMGLQEPKKDKKIPIVEIFGPTIQGEGLVAGQRTTFIRFGLCDYKCKMCDSMHAVDPRQVKANAAWLTQYEVAQSVLDRLIVTNCSNVTYSGGNPCIHDLENLTNALNAAGVRIALETQGTLFPDWVYLCDWITVSPKAPGMGEQFEPDKFMEWVNAFANNPHFCVKIVIFSAQDLEFASGVLELMPEVILNEDRFYLSVGNPNPPGTGDPAFEQDPDLFSHIVREQVDQVMDDLKGFPRLRKARILPQVHTLLWGQAKGR